MQARAIASASALPLLDLSGRPKTVQHLGSAGETSAQRHSSPLSAPAATRIPKPCKPRNGVPHSGPTRIPQPPVSGLSKTSNQAPRGALQSAAAPTHVPEPCRPHPALLLHSHEILQRAY